MSSSDVNQNQTVQAASPSIQNDNIETPAPLDLSSNAPQTATSISVRSVRFSDDVLTMLRVVFLEPPGWFSL